MNLLSAAAMDSGDRSDGKELRLPLWHLHYFNYHFHLTTELSGALSVRWSDWL